jgi:hypothetical protein
MYLKSLRADVDVLVKWREGWNVEGKSCVRERKNIVRIYWDLGSSLLWMGR